MFVTRLHRPDRRWLFLVPTIATPALVALSRMYRGEHHPTDVLGSLLFSALWITALTLLIKPGPHDPDQAGPATVGRSPEHATAGTG